MKRGHHALLGAVLGFCACRAAPSPQDIEAVKQAVRENYAVYNSFDERRYRTTTTEDFVLLEQGEVIDREGDVASMPKAGSGHRRTDEFDFRSVNISGDVAYTVYVLRSEIFDDIKGARSRQWLESAVLRWSEGGWKVALMHSTRISQPAGARDVEDFAVRYTAAWCSQDPARVAAFFADDGSLTINDGPPAIGRAAITEAARRFMRELPDLVVEMDRLEREAGLTRYHWTLTGTDSGPGGGGAKVRISGFEEWTLGPDGLIASSRGQFDAADYARQLAGR
jgi:ketosteroid isomerase-like protein